MIVSLVVLIVEIGVIAAIGVGLSGILAKPALLGRGDLSRGRGARHRHVIAFGLGGSAVRSEATQQYRSYDLRQREATSTRTSAASGKSTTYEMPRFDYVWWMLAANPFVILADATPTTFEQRLPGRPLRADQVRGAGSAAAARLEQSLRRVQSRCGAAGADRRRGVASTTPSWFVGLGLQVLLAAGLLWWAWARTRTPARRLPPGTRIA